jgi:membrane-associated protease RseP (regulator of RpoE activity)
MGPPSFEPDETGVPERYYLPRTTPLPPRDRRWRHVVLFLATAVTTTVVGADHWFGYYTAFSSRDVPFSAWQLLARGLWYSVPILAILGAHEMGHYYACRYYGVDASRPYFLPMPLVLTGTLGAFIRIRQPIPNKRELFDIGVAGPIAGFLVAVPALFLGMYLSSVVRIPPDFSGNRFELGEPLLFQAAAWLTFGPVADPYTINMHPMAFAAWFGLIATALNLFPIGQLDGGHISYAVLGQRSTIVTLVTAGSLVVLSFLSTSWLAWTVLTLAMLLAFGPRHPRTADEEEPLDPARLWMAAFALVMFVLCFTPAPIEPFDLVRQR